MRFTSESAVGDSWLLSFSTPGGSRSKRYLETRLSAVLFVTAYGTSPHGSPPIYTPVVTCGIRIVFLPGALILNLALLQLTPIHPKPMSIWAAIDNNT